jgi:hypothetical protein
MFGRIAIARHQIYFRRHRWQDRPRRGSTAHNMPKRNPPAGMINLQM